MSRGRFITLEGGDGAGKSTHTAALARWLEARGVPALTTREPGGAEGAEQIRQLLVTGEPGRWDGMTETLLHLAARRDHLVRTVWPALAAGRWVISDRFADSTLAYQGWGQGLSPAVIGNLHQLAIDGFLPDLTLVLDLPAAEGLARARARHGDQGRYERMDLAFHERLRRGFLAIAEAEPQRCAVIDAGQPLAAVAAAIEQAVSLRLPVPPAP